MLTKKETNRKKRKQFYCELYDTHEWEEYQYLKNEKGWWILYRCKKCGKKKREKEPIMEIPTVFSKF